MGVYVFKSGNVTVFTKSEETAHKVTSISGIFPQYAKEIKEEDYIGENFYEVQGKIKNERPVVSGIQKKDEDCINIIENNYLNKLQYLDDDLPRSIKLYVRAKNFSEAEVKAQTIFDNHKSEIRVKCLLKKV